MKHILLISTFLLALTFGLSLDASAQWVDVYNANCSISSFIVKSGKIFAGTGCGVLVSADNGATWTNMSKGLGDSTVWALFESGSNIFAGTEGGVFVTSDDGANWSERNTGLTEHTFVNDAVYGFAQVGSTLFAGTSPHGVYSSDLSGGSWGQVNGGIDVPEINALASIGSDLYAGTMEGGVYHSSDLGSSWQQVNGGLNATQVNDLLAVGQTLFAGTPTSGAFRSTNMGGSWTHINSGFADSSYVNGFAASGTNLFAMLDGGVYLSIDNGSHWTAKNEGFDYKRIRAMTFNGTDAFAGGFTATIWKRPMADLTALGVTTPAAARMTAENFPNPFSRTTTIRFATAERGYATVTIVNQLGQVIARVFAGDLEAGPQSIRWSAPLDLARGMYECVVATNGNLMRVPVIYLP